MSEIKTGTVRVTMRSLIETYVSTMKLEPGSKIVGVEHLFDSQQGIMQIDVRISEEGPANEPAE